MRSRVSLLLIALYSVKIFFALGDISKTASGQSKLQRRFGAKQPPIKNNTNHNSSTCYDMSCVRIYDKVNPNGRFNFRYAIMLFD